MSKTTILFVVLFFGGIAASIVHPIYPLMAYLLDYYQHPPLRWWGRELPRGIRWALLASIAALLATFLHGRLVLSAQTLKHRPIRALILLCLIAAAVTVIAVDFDRSLHYATLLCQLTLLVLVIIVSIDQPKHWRYMVLVMALGSFTWGFDAWMDPGRVAGRLQAIGGPDSFNDNSAAIHLLAVLPFLAVMGFYGSRLEQVVAVIAFPFVLNTIILCNSRGATVAMGAMMVAAAMLVRGKLRARIIVLALAGGLALLALSDEEFYERQLTLFSGEVDGSSQSRLDSWMGALELMRDYPLGAGGGGFDILSPQYIPEIVARYDGAERGVHNTYLWVGSDWGAAGLACYVTYLFGTFVSVHKARRRSPDARLAMEGLAVQLSIVGIGVGGIFISRTYGEIMYWIPALGIALVNLIDNAAATQASATQGLVAAPVPRDEAPSAGQPAAREAWLRREGL